jgi:hypothetical protein
LIEFFMGGARIYVSALVLALPRPIATLPGIIDVRNVRQSYPKYSILTTRLGRWKELYLQRTYSPRIWC